MPISRMGAKGCRLPSKAGVIGGALAGGRESSIAGGLVGRRGSVVDTPPGQPSGLRSCGRPQLSPSGGVFLLAQFLEITSTQGERHDLPALGTGGAGVRFARGMRLGALSGDGDGPGRSRGAGLKIAPDGVGADGGGRGRATGDSGGFGEIGISDRGDGAVTNPARCGSRRRSTGGILSAFAEGLQKIDPLAALKLELADGLLKGTFGLVFGSVLGGDTISVVIVDRFQGGAPRSQGFLFILLFLPIGASKY